MANVVSAVPVRSHDNGGIVVDIRVFLSVLTLAMAASFMAGVGLEPFTMPKSLQSFSLHPSSSEAPTVSPTEQVHSVNLLDPSQVLPHDEEHLPAGQHLLVDMRNVDSSFLNSESRLADAMMETIKESGLTMLSYHCHSLLPNGVSCVGVLLESHISFHTWPDDGVITLDLFTCGSSPLLPVVPTLKRLFGIGENVYTKWSHELRGFRSDEQKKQNYLDDSSDLTYWVLSPLDMHSKTQVYSNSTSLQRVDIWDLVEITDRPTFMDVIKHNMTPDDARLRDPAYVTPDRLLFLDGTIQSLSSTERVYHEAMVHPALFAHPNPKHVAILGGGEGATLREVLKHKTLESATMIEMDSELVEICREHLASMSNCSDLIGRAENCFDDALTELYFEDGRKWFLDRFGPSPSIKPAHETLDVVLLDALDPEDDTEASGMLYSDDAFISAMMNSLSENGILAIQVGTAASIDDPRPDMGIYKNRENLFNMLEARDDVEAMLVYEDANCGFLEPHSFLIVCKSVDCRSRWYARSDEIDYQIYDRIVHTQSKERALTYFDGTTQYAYQWPKKGWETVYCRREPMPFECNYRSLSWEANIHEIDLTDPSKSSFRFEPKETEDGEKQASIYATVDIAKGSFIMAEHLSKSVELSSRNLEGLKNNAIAGGAEGNRVAIIEDLLQFLANFTHASKVPGSNKHYVEVGATCFIRRVTSEGEANVAHWLPPHPTGKRPKFSPVYERHRVSHDVLMVASRDIKAGDEVVMLQVDEGSWFI
ncbi:hypothetical protein MPSEU_000955700 [Mayamaea pseudoterrestris]|nr:hypothetical protein MPSEU_000955700 [Mayamaea pseudoterrestris]